MDADIIDNQSSPDHVGFAGVIPAYELLLRSRGHLRTECLIQLRSTATSALPRTLAVVQKRPGQRQRGSKRFVRGVQDEEARS
jgi:hypothetical protein